MFQPCFHTKAQKKHEYIMILIQVSATKQVPANCSQQLAVPAAMFQPPNCSTKQLKIKFFMIQVQTPHEISCLN
jgi:hypothetical protein